MLRLQYRLGDVAPRHADALDEPRLAVELFAGRRGVQRGVVVRDDDVVGGPAMPVDLRWVSRLSDNLLEQVLRLGERDASQPQLLLDVQMQGRLAGPRVFRYQWRVVDHTTPY